MSRKPIASAPLREPRHAAEEPRHQSLAELASEQGITAPQNFESLCGAGTDLWEDEAAFEAFMAGLRESRQTGG